MDKVYLSLGGNISDRGSYLERARKLLEERAGRIVAASSVYETEPWGFETSELFLNQVLAIETELDPHALLEVILGIEKLLGRIRDRNGYSSRQIDIDILFYRDEVIHEDCLKIPHPRIHERMFALKPMYELEKSLVHPVFRKPISQLFNECPDNLRVEVFDPQKS